MTPKPSKSTLAAYLTGAAGTGAMLVAPQADAGVVAVTFPGSPDFPVLQSGGAELGYAEAPGFNLGWLSAGTNGGKFHLGYFTNYYMVGGNVYHTGNYTPGGPTYNSGLIQFFQPGDTIGTGGNGDRGVAYFQSDAFAGLNLGADQDDKYIGFITSSGNYGWANVSWDESAKTLTFNEVFIEAVPNAPITIPLPVPEPSVSLLALAGIGGAVLRRRRNIEH